MTLSMPSKTCRYFMTKWLPITNRTTLNTMSNGALLLTSKSLLILNSQEHFKELQSNINFDRIEENGQSFSNLCFLTFFLDLELDITEK